MLRILFISAFLFFTGNILLGQDTIYMISREKVVAKVQEINPTQIKYKLFSFPDGPTYVVNKKQVWKIVYSDGHSEFFQDEIAQEEIAEIHPILVGVNSFDMMFGFISVSGEYYFAKRGVSIKLPVSIGVQGVKGAAESNYYDHGYYYYNRMKVISTGAQLLFYPGHMKHKVNYFTGLSFEYGRMFSRQTYWGYPYPYPSTSKITYDWFGTGIVNGVMINLSDRVSLGMSATLGMEVVYRSSQQNFVGVTSVSTEPMGRMDFTLGVRFGKIQRAEK